MLEYDFGHARSCTFRCPKMKEAVHFLCTASNNSFFCSYVAVFRLRYVLFRFRWLWQARNSGPAWYWQRRKRGGSHDIPPDDARSRSRPKGTAFALSTSKLSELCPYSSLFPISGQRPGHFTSTLSRCTCSAKELYDRTVFLTSL